MNAIILAAGLGSRFKDITKKEHKSLLKIGDKPNLERTIEYLTDAKVEKIIIGRLQTRHHRPASRSSATF